MRLSLCHLINTHALTESRETKKNCQKNCRVSIKTKSETQKKSGRPNCWHYTNMISSFDIGWFIQHAGLANTKPNKQQNEDVENGARVHR